MPKESGERTIHDWLRHIDTKLDEHRNSMERRLTVIDSKLDKKGSSEGHDDNVIRIRKLEAFANRAKGIAAFISLVGGVVVTIFLMGCATTKTRCVYEDGTLKYSSTRATVVGKGDVDILVEACDGATFETHDTGISDNATKVVEKAVEGAVKGVLGSATIDAAAPVVGGLIQGAAE